MTAAVSLGSSVQTIAQGASGMVATLPAALPGSVQATAMSSAQIAADLAAVEKPAKAMAAAVPKSSGLLRVAGFLSKALPIVTITASGLAGARIVNDEGAGALLTSKEGRSAVLGALGGTLLLVPHPAAQIAAAGTLGFVAANHFGALDRLDRRAARQAAPPPPPPPSAGYNAV